MERRTYAAILLLVLGIIEVYSFPSETYPTDPELSRRASVDEEQPRSSLRAVPFGDDDHGRIKRDDKERSKPLNGDKPAQLAEFARVQSERILRREIINTMTRERTYTPGQRDALISSYMREFVGMSRNQAIEQFRTDHPTLGSALFPKPRL